VTISTKPISAAGTQLEIRPDWLALHEEPILDPDLPIIDPHHHLWDASGRRYLFDDFLADLSTGHRIVSTVFVQCHAMYRASGPEAMKPVGETEFVAGAAAQSESGQYGPTHICAGIVGSLDPMLGDGAAPVIDAHIAAGGGRFRGIRLRSAWDADPEVHRLPTPPDVLMQPQTRAAVARIQKAGLLLDVWCLHPQMPQVLDLCRAFPDLTIIIDHIAGPVGIGAYRDRRDSVLAEWRHHVRELAKLPNTLMKIGGLGMRVIGHDLHLRERPPSSQELADLWRPYVDHCLQCFSPGRCMFESNFPVDKAMFSYPVMWNAFKRLTSAYSAAERASLFAGNAARAYRLPDDGSRRSSD